MLHWLPTTISGSNDSEETEHLQNLLTNQTAQVIQLNM